MGPVVAVVVPVLVAVAVIEIGMIVQGAVVATMVPDSTAVQVPNLAIEQRAEIAELDSFETTAFLESPMALGAVVVIASAVVPIAVKHVAAAAAAMVAWVAKTVLVADPGADLDVDPGAGLDVDLGASLDVDPSVGLDVDPGVGLDADPGAGLDVDPGAGLVADPDADHRLDAAVAHASSVHRSHGPQGIYRSELETLVLATASGTDTRADSDWV